MADRLKFHYVEQRPPFERVALLLQGGGALGSYQAGVYQALAEANLHPDWVAGISIGAINAALIAGNPPEKRVEKLREFWEAVSAPPLGPSRYRSLQSTSRDASVHRAYQSDARICITVSVARRNSSLPVCRRPFLFSPASPDTLSYL